MAKYSLLRYLLAVFLEMFCSRPCMSAVPSIGILFPPPPTRPLPTAIGSQEAEINMSTAFLASFSMFAVGSAEINSSTRVTGNGKLTSTALSRLAAR